MEYTSVTNPVWANEEHTMIDCIVTFTAYGPVPFTSSPTDSTTYGPQIYADCESGAYGPVGPYVPVEPPTPPITEGAQPL